jgi:hypothetical protein
MNTVEILKAGRELISDPARWTQTTYARAENGEILFGDDPGAICWCSRGALQKVLNTHRSIPPKVGMALDAAARQLARRNVGVIEFNDSRTHAEVLAMWDRAIANAERGA